MRTIKKLSCQLKKAVLSVLLATAVTATAFHETKAQSNSASRKTKNQSVGTWHTSTFVSPHIAGMPEAVLIRHEGLHCMPVVAVWSDGTVAWLDENKGKEEFYFVSKVSGTEISHAIKNIKEYTASIFPEGGQSVGTRNTNIDCGGWDPGASFVLLDGELFVRHLWSDEVLQGYGQVKKLLADSRDLELVEFFQSRLARPVFSRPAAWEFIADEYARYAGIKSEEVYKMNSTGADSRKAFKIMARHFVKDADHFVFCQKSIRSLIPRSQQTSLVSKPLDFSWQSVAVQVRWPDDTRKSAFSYQGVKDGGEQR